MTDQIDFSTMSGFVLETVLDNINSVLKKASLYNGRVYGGFVRNVIVPRKSDNKCHVKFKDVDIWFQKDEDASNFVYDLNERLEVSRIDNANKHEKYPFTRRQYDLYQFKTLIAFIDVIVSEKMPVDDFNVNCLTAKYVNDNIVFESWSQESPETLIDMILRKKAIMFPQYIAKINGHSKTNQCSPIHMAKVYYERYLRLFGDWDVIIYPCGTLIPKRAPKSAFNEHLNIVICLDKDHNPRSFNKQNIINQLKQLTLELEQK